MRVHVRATVRKRERERVDVKFTCIYDGIGYNYKFVVFMIVGLILGNPKGEYAVLGEDVTKVTQK